MVLDGLLLGSAFNCAFEFVKEHSQVLLDVHLFNDVDPIALPVLESMAVGFRIDVHLLTEKKTCEKRLPLQEQIILVWIVIIVWVLDGKDVVSEAWDHEKLLVQTIHIANAR